MTTTEIIETEPLPAPSPVDSAAPPVVKIRRHTVDVFLVWSGVVVAVVLLVAGGLLTWGNRFASDYVHDELSSQNIFFPPAEALEAGGRSDLVKYADQQLTTGDQAEAYASYIGGHLEDTADGMTYAEIGTPQRAARAALADAIESGAPDDEVAALQEELDTLDAQRDTLFRGETLRGLLLSTYAWSTIGTIAGWAALAAFIGAAVMGVLVMMGMIHLARSRKAT